MTCELFEARLDALLDGRCSADQWREAEAHLAACAGCRRVFDAMSGRADELDDEGHELLLQSVMAKTSGGACGTARGRLCDFVDGVLPPFDRQLVDGHLAHCQACATLASALEESTSLLPSFASLAPRVSLVRGVLTATSLRPVERTFGERVSEWLAQAAQRPRFSLEVAYVLTVLLLVVLGNPVSAFREASVRVQPRVSLVADAVSRPLAQARARGEETLSRMERAIRPTAEPVSSLAEGRDLLWRWWLTNVDAPVRAIVSQVNDWAGRAFEALRKAIEAPGSEPATPTVR
jgi:anti-sigma factor RsiW